MTFLRCIPCLMALLWAAGGPVFGQDTLSGEALVQALRRGGYNIYFRHAATDWSQQDQVAAAGDWTSCDSRRMRQLSAEGWETARQIGAAIRRLGIPIGQVLSSEYCRAWETATAMGLGPAEKTRAVMNMRAASFVGGPEAVKKRARRAIGTPPPEGANTVFVAHGNLMRAVSGAYTGEAGAVVFAPQGGGQFTLVAQLTPDDWKALANRHAVR